MFAQGSRSTTQGALLLTYLRANSIYPTLYSHKTRPSQIRVTLFNVPQRDLPPSIWKTILMFQLGAVAFVIALLTLSLGAISDPQPLGKLAVQENFQTAQGWIRIGNESSIQSDLREKGVLSISGQGRSIILAPYEIHPPGTLILIARQASGDTNAGYGLWWGGQGAPQLTVGINSDGYLAVLPGETADPALLRPWRVFPHVRGAGIPNKIQADIDTESVVIRVNDELAARFEWKAARELSFGLYAETLTPGSAALMFEQLQIWEVSPGPSP